MFKKKLTLKILSFLIFSDILETVTQLFFKKSVFNFTNFAVNNPLDVLAFLKSVFLSGYLWAGMLSVILTFIIWSTLLSKIDLSVAVPLASFSYILVPLVSIFLLQEKISLLRWTGISLILLGVIVVSLTSKEKELPIP